jgi:hypothetical protein
VRVSSVLLRTGVLLAVAASSAAAQTRLSTDLFFARNNTLASGTPLYGLGLGLFGGPLGLRGSGAMAFRTEVVDRAEVVKIGAWTAEVDLILQPALLGGERSVFAFAPYVFGGVGRISGIEVDGARSHWTGASYGAGVSVPLTRALGVSGEGRYRLPLAEALDENSMGIDRSFPRGWEYRFGLAISLGG